MIPEYRSALRHPFMSLLNLIFLSLAGMLGFMLLGILFIFLSGEKNISSALLSGSFSVENLKVLQLFISVGTFIFPAWYFSRQESYKGSDYFKLNKKPDLVLLILAIILTYSITPFIEWTLSLNQKMIFPEFLKGLELWMRQKEEEAAFLTRQFLSMTSVNDLFFNMLLIGIIPAIGEELFFRGCVQKIFSRWSKNHHYGIWIAAIIFSAIHFQFFGFVPRMLLGALFGYLYFWSNNLLIPIIAHFINNGTQVLMAYVYQKNGESLDGIDRPENYPLYISAISLILTVFLLILFYRFSQRKNNADGHRLD